MILASTKQGLQKEKASGVIVNSENTHSNRELVSGVIYYTLNGHFLEPEQLTNSHNNEQWKKKLFQEYNNTLVWTNPERGFGKIMEY